MELHYYLWGQPEASPSHVSSAKRNKIVLLHGMGGTGALWRPIGASLEDHIDLLALDQRGHGKSRVPHIPGSRQEAKFTPMDYGSDVIDTLGKLNFHPTWLLGHSMGVRTAVAAAYLKREWVKGLILVDLGLSGVAGGGLGEGLAQFLRKLPPTFVSRDEARKFMQEYCPDPSIAQYLMAVSTRLPDGQVEFPFDHSALIKTIEAARDVSVRNWLLDLAKDQMPILILRGQKSLVWSHAEFLKEKETFAGFPSVEFAEIADAGHGLPFEQRIRFIEKIKKSILT